MASGGWNDCSAIKREVQLPAPTWWLITICNSCSRDFMPTSSLFGHQAFTWYIDIHVQKTHTQKKISKFQKWQVVVLPKNIQKKSDSWNEIISLNPRHVLTMLRQIVVLSWLQPLVYVFVSNLWVRKKLAYPRRKVYFK